VDDWAFVLFSSKPALRVEGDNTIQRLSCKEQRQGKKKL
jgi:hypothetical protein